LIESLSYSVQQSEIADALIKAKKAVKSSMSFKMALEETVFYVCTTLFIEKRIVVDISFLLEKLRVGLIIDDRKYLAKVLEKLNKGYITITAVE
jgi:hypothetical protein